MKISVITPSYKQLQWLKLCIASVADQQEVEFEHIIQDAHTGKELEDWVHTHSQAKLFVERDSGMYDAINRGFLKATGDIVAWLNSDEQYLPGTLAKVAAFFEEHPDVEVLFGDALLLSDQGALLSYRRSIIPSLLHVQLSHLNTLSCATFVRRSVIEKGFLLKPQWKAIADGVWVGDMLKAKLRMAVLPEPLAAFTMTEENLGQSSFAFKETERWLTESTRPWQRKLKPAVIAWHRLRKLWHGAYVVRNSITEIYTKESPDRRVLASAQNLSFAWTDKKAESGIRSHLRKFFGALARGFKGGNNRLGISKTLPFRFYSTPHYSWRFCLLLAIALAGIILLFEQQTSEAIIIAPMLSTFLMLVLAFRFEPVQLIPFALIFGVTIYYSLHYMQPFHGTSTEWIRITLRLFGFSVASTMALLFSKYRGVAMDRLDQTVSIIISMPVPVVISDALGVIIFANNEASEFVKIPREKLQGSNYIKLFMAQGDEGTAMRNYIKFFQTTSESNGAHLPGSRGLRLFVDSGKLQEMEARFICLGEGQARYMVTVIKV